MAVDPLAPSPAPGAYTNNTARLKINEIVTISGGSIVAWVKEPNSGDAI